MAREMTPQERAAALYRALGDGCDLSAPEQEKRDIEAITDALTDTRRAALLEARQASEQVTLQSVRAEIRWREKHASEEVDGIAKSERAECHLRSLGLAIMDAIDRLAQEG